MNDDEAKWKKRLLAYTGARMAGLAVFGLGVAIFYTDLIREDGWPQVGAIVIILGLIDALFLPMVLKRQWEKDDGRGK